MNTETLPFHNYRTDSALIFLMYALLLVPFLFLSLKIKPFQNVSELPKGDFFNFLLIFLAIGILFSLVYLTPYAIKALSENASDFRVCLKDEESLPPTYLTTLAVGFPTFYYIYVFFFYVCIIQKKSLLITTIMLLGIVAFIVNVFTAAGRDGVFLAFFALLIGYFLFEPLLSQKRKKVFKMSFIIFSLIGMAFILKITTDRFAINGHFNFQAFKNGVISYLGMQPFIFSDWINYNKLFNHGNSEFKLFVDLAGVSTSTLYEYNTDPYMWNFGTFLTSFYSVSGFFSLFTLASVFWLYFKLMLNKIRQYYVLSNLFLLSFYFHFIVTGVFYFRLGTSGGNIFMLLCIIAVYLLRKKIVFK
ncbi:MAG: oligosaccharide repeat unit polymerase [Ferruginibacter sp.]|nr:oligosaccharide repeat unit polymerase [Ferruginibacter sp.]